MKRHIYLTGFMGAGKSRIGRYLAQVYQLPFVDTDRWIEGSTAKKIKDIFEEDGEPVFRQLEKQAISRAANLRDPAVISLGGGALLDDKNFQKVKDTGILIYIKSSPEAVFERTKNSDKRPLLQVEKGKNSKELLMKKIKTMMDSREEIYQQADIIFNRDNLEVEEAGKKLKIKIDKMRKVNHENH